MLIMKNILDMTKSIASLIDFYECGLNATQANTMGVGNPMPAIENTPGSEPLVPAKKCKKVKCKKEKIDEASILGDIEDTLKTGDDIANAIFDLANHLADCAKHYESTSYTEDEILELTNYAINNKAISIGKPGEIIYDSNGFDNIKDRKTSIFVRELFYNFDAVVINPKTFPKSIKKITFKNFSIECDIDLYGDNDISNLDITVEGAALRVTVKESNNIVKLGKVTCEEFIMSDNHIKNIKPVGVSFKSGSSIKNIDLGDCTCIESIIGSKLGTSYFSLNKNIVRHNLIKSGLANSKAKIYLE